LPGTLNALGRGALTWEHTRVMAELISPLDDAVRLQAETRLLARLGSTTPTQLRAAAHRVVARLDAEAISRRVREAIRDRRISVYPGADGMATLCATLPSPVARAVEDALRQYADAAAAPGDERTRAQRMVDCLVDLVLRPGEHGLAPVQAQLTVVATVSTLLGDDEPGEVNGDLVPAETVRRLAESLGSMPPGDTAAAMDTASPDAPADTAPLGAASATRAAATGWPALTSEAGSALADLLAGCARAGLWGRRLPRTTTPPPPRRMVRPATRWHLRPLRRRRAELAADPAAVLEVLARGNARANELADATLDRVRSAMRMV
jgi:hypothetical protein